MTSPSISVLPRQPGTLPPFSKPTPHTMKFSLSLHSSRPRRLSRAAAAIRAHPVAQYVVCSHRGCIALHRTFVRLAPDRPAILNQWGRRRCPWMMDNILLLTLLTSSHDISHGLLVEGFPFTTHFQTLHVFNSYSGRVNHDYAHHLSLPSSRTRYLISNS